MPPLSDYKDYYARTIAQHTTGLKLVIGGTGLGKTSGIKPAIREVPVDRKAIYIANRLQLLEEMVDPKSGFAPNEVAFLRRDFEVVMHTLHTLRGELYTLMEDDLFRANVGKVDVGALRRSCKLLEDLRDQMGSPFIPKLLEEKAEERARHILISFRTVILNAKKKRERDYGRLLDHAVVQSLFPFIRFTRRAEVRILLITLQKTFYGFFDGSQTLELSTLSGYLVFLDEFDFLENDLISLIARSPQLDDPFQFVEFFHAQLTRHKLGLDNYPVSGSPDVRNRLVKIVKEIRWLREAGYRYPEINQFICREPQINAAVFRTAHTISTAPLYLCQTKRAFEIVFQRGAACEDKTLSTRRLLSTVSGVSQRILTLLKELEIDDPNTYADMVRDCYRNTSYVDLLPQISRFPRRRVRQSTRLGSLLESGYSLYDIRHLSKQTDPEEVELRHFAIYSTPEKLIATLADNNLVFGLSATADIPRCLNNFDLRWMGQSGNTNVIPVDDDDHAIVQARNAEKAARRKNRIAVVRLPDAGRSTTLEKALKQFLDFVANEEGFGKDTGGEHLKKRVERFFASLLWACQRSPEERATDTHLIFLNSFKQIKFVFEDAPPNERLFTVHKRETLQPLTAYDFSIQGQTFIVVFYDAEQAKRVRSSKELREHFNALFWQGLPVVVVTQYLSAGNGVNLQYSPTPESTEDRDFLHLHLLEAPYFYFGNLNADQPEEEQTAIVKENIWYQAKLHEAKYLSEAEFKTRLRKLHNPAEWNMQYQQHPNTSSDYALNSIAACIQALGRTERVWEEMKDQTVIMSDEVHVAFQRFVIAPEFAYIRTRREPIISNNLRQVLAQIEAQSEQIADQIAGRADQRLRQVNMRCREKLTDLVDRFEAVRSGQDSTTLRSEWIALRRAGLRHDFADERLQQYGCAFKSPYISDGIVQISEESEIVPPDLAHPQITRWRLNSVYDIIRENPHIRNYFRQQGYELDFALDGQYCFTPYFYQAILTGAIGEEAISVLLRHSKIELEDVPDALFEVADLKVLDKPWYIDCKNYSEATLDRFSLTPDDLLFHPKLYEPTFVERAREKWQQIAGYHHGKACLIYINLTTAHERPLGLYTRDFTPLPTFDGAEIIVVQGALDSDDPNLHHDAFQRLLNELKTRNQE